MGISHRRGRGLGLLLVAGLVGLVVPSSAGAADDPGVFRVGATFEATSLNPFVDYGGAYPWALTYDFLTAELVPGPGFADTWTVSPDGTEWTFKIRPGMTWSDGEPATARDAAFTYNYLLGSIGTPDELTNGWNNTATIGAVLESATASDDTTLVLKLKHPSQWPLMTGIFIIPEHVWKDVSYKDALTTYPNNVPIVGSGPYVATEFVPGQYLKMVANDTFRDGRPAVDEIIFQVFKTDDAVVTALKAGEIDFALSVPVAQVESLADPNITAISATTGERIALVFNTASGTKASSTALQDSAFRDALGYALDKQTIVDKVRRGQAVVGVSMAIPEIPTYFSQLPGVARQFSLDTAKAKLEAAGYVDSNGDGTREDKDGKELDLRLYIPVAGRSSADIASSAQFVVDWFKQVGISTTATAMEKASLRAQYKSPADGGGDWDMSIDTYWPFAQPVFAFEQVLTTHIGSDNWAAWSNPEMDALWGQLAQQVTQEASAPIVDQMSTLAYQQAPYHVLYYANQNQAYRTDRFVGWTRRPSPDAPLAYSYYGQETWVLLKPIAEPAASPAAPSASAAAGGSPAAPTATATPAASPAPDSSGSGGSSTLLVAGGAIVLVVVVALVLRRRRAE